MSHRTLSLFAAGWVCLAVPPMLPASVPEIFVDAQAAAGGNGAAASPYRTLNEAVKSVAGPATITIREGVYRETVNLKKSGEASAPLLIRATEGERVEVTGFDPISGWKMSGHLAKVKVDGPVYDLCVGGERQRMARFPDKMSPWLKVNAAEGLSFQAEVLPEIPAAELNGLCLGMLIKDFNMDWCVPVAGINAETRTVKIDPAKPHRIQAGDTFVYYNAPSFIKYPGDWACQPVDGGYEITFWPADPRDLEKTQFRRRSSVINAANVHDVTLRGLEITGAINTGLMVSNCTNFKVERCLVYHNGLPGTTNPYGIFFRQCKNSSIDACIVFLNLRGIGVMQGRNNVVNGCEIAFNDNDGVNFTGSRAQKEDPAVSLTLSHCYLHSHIYLGHADNFQMWGWVEDPQYHDNLSILAAQNMMMEQVRGLRARNSVLFSTGARQAILGGSGCSDAHFQNLTFLWGNLGAIGFFETTAGVEIFDNVFYATPLNYGGMNPRGGNNLFWSPRPNVNLVTDKRSGRKFRIFKTLEGIDETGLEARSRQVDPQFGNVPEAQAISNDPARNTRDTLYFGKPGSLAGFAQGDTIEINFDAVPRTIQSLGEDRLVFAPALAAAPFRDVTVWGWGKRTDLRIDLRSPVAGGKGQPGASIDVAAYQRGELDGSGRRSIPELSAPAQSAFFDPAVYPFPFSLPVTTGNLEKKVSDPKELPEVP